MRIYSLNCGTMCPVGGAWMDGRSGGASARLVCHCWLVETRHRLVLVDTGLGCRDIDHTYPRLSRFYVDLLRPRLRPQETALHQVRSLGFDPADVRHLLLTHLDFDHAGGLDDFPHAQVHLLAAELEAGRHRHGFVGRRRYRPRQWRDADRWQVYRPGGEAWFGFRAVRQLQGLPPEILLIPLAGHTWGHTGVAVASDGGWRLHAGDSYFHHDEIHAQPARCPPGLRAYQRLMEVDRGARLANQARLRALAAGGEVGVSCSHDAGEFEQAAAVPAASGPPRRQ